MLPSNFCEVKKILKVTIRRLFTLISFIVIFNVDSIAQPAWFGGTPTVTPHPASEDFSYGIDRVGKIYVILFNYNIGAVYSSAIIKNAAISGPATTIISTWVINVPLASINNIFTITALNQLGGNIPLLPNHDYTFYFVAEDAAGNLQAVPVRIMKTTLPCPKVDILTGFTQPVVCVNLGTNVTFQVAIVDPPNSGIMKGTQWTLNWGDGSPVTNFTSSVDYEIPPLALRQHLYTTVTSCNYVFTNSVRNPCGETRTVQYVAVVHGRDVPSDGDGMLRIVNNATGSSTIQICEGTQAIITMRDNSIWNCQNPVLPGGLLAVPNTDPRNIEWLYGRDPSGALFNTITGTVTIATMGNAPQASGRLSPIPAPNTLSQAITIPATCKAGEYFRVYLKNWNKCNWGDPEYVSTYVDILVVSAPPAPTAPSRTVCIGDDKTLTVTGAPVGTITWYSDAGLTTQVGTGLTFVPPQSTAGTYTYYVTDKQSTGLLCQSKPTTVTLTISPKPSVPTLSYPNKNDICYGVEPPESYTITASAAANPPITGYQWFKDGVLLPGRNHDTIYITKPDETGSYTVRSVGAAPSFCMSDPSAAQYVTVHTLLNVTQPLPQLICENQTAIFTASTTEQIASWQWEISTNGGVSFTTVGNGPPYNGFNTNTLTVTTPPFSFNGYYYRVEMKTPPGQGGCRFKSDKALLTVDGLPSATAGSNLSRCSNSPLDPIYMTGATKGGTSSSVIWSGGGGLGTWTQNDNPALAYFTPSVPSGSFTATLRVTGTAACNGVVATGTRTVRWAQTPVVDAGANISRCDATPLAAIAMTGATATGTYSAQSWSGGAGLGSWTQNANPALAVFTPSVTSGSFTATLSLTGSGACNGTNVTDTRTITWGQTPVATAGAALSRCDGTPLAAIPMTGATATGTYSGEVWSGGGGLGSWTQNANPALAVFTPTATSGSFTATLTLTGSGACTGSNSVSTRTVEWSYAATVNAGPDQSICANATVTLAGSIGGGASSATWTGGTGTFNPNNTTLNAVYTPSPAEKAAQTVTLTLTTNDPPGICPAASDNMTISIGTLPTAAVLTTSGDWCFGNGANWLNVSITGGGSPYRIRYRKNGVVQADITPYISGTNYSLGTLPIGNYTYEVFEIRDNCGNIFIPSPTLTNSFTVYQKPNANAGSDAGVCGTLVTSLNAIPSVGTGTWSVVSGPGTITFTPNVNSPSVTATASTYGSYVLRWTEVNGGICSSSSDITVAYERAATAGPAQNLCGTLSFTLAGNTPAAGTGTWTRVSGPGTASFSPNANTPNAVVTVSVAGNYIFKWTIANSIFCSTNQDVNFTFEKLANPGSDQRLCGTLVANLAGNAPVVGPATWSMVSGPGTVVFGPTVNTPNATATVTQYGTYVFRWTIANGIICSTFNDATVVYNPSGQVNQPANQVLCNGSNTAAVNFSTTNIGGTTTYSWTNSAPGIGLAASGNGNIAAFAAINNGTAPVVASIVVTPTYSDGMINCPGPSKTFTITVNPTGQINQPANLVVCNTAATGAINFTTNNTVGTTTYAWTNTVTGIGLAASGSGNIASFTAVNAGLVPVTATITVTPSFTNGGVVCDGPSKTFTITVNPTAQVTQPANLAVCNGGTASVTFTTTTGGGATTYTWTNSNTAIGLAASGSGNISFTGTNAGTAPITGTITVTPTFSNAGTNCTGPAKTFTITINPTGQVNQPVNQTICNGATGTVNFATVNTVGTTSYAWTNTNATIGLGANGSGNISFTAINNGTAPVSATITVTPTFNFGGTDCAGPTKTFTLTINPTPALSSSLTPPDICSNTAFSYIPTSLTVGTTFAWTRAVVAGITPAGPTSGNNNPNETLRNTTNIPIGVTYRYTLTAGGCTNVQNVIVNIKPEPVIVPGQTDNVCSGNMTNYHINLSNFINPVDNVTFTWLAPVLNPVNPAFTGGSARPSASAANIADIFTNTTGANGTATYTVTPYKDGCAGAPVTVVLTIRSQPVLNAGLNTTVCSNTAIGLILKEAAGSVLIDYYNISTVTLDAGLAADPGNAAIANPSAPANYLANDKYVNITGVNKNVTYRVQPFKAPDCYGTPLDIVITVRPQPFIVPAQVKTVCSGVAVGKEILLSPANTPAGSRFNWPAPAMSDFSVQGTAGVNVAADPAGKFHINDQLFNYSAAPITATYSITPVSAAGCTGTTIPVIITVNPEPVPKVISGRDKICAGELNLVYNVASSPGSTYHWTVDPAVGTKTFDFNTNAIIINAAAAAGIGNISVFETNSFACDGDPFVLPVQVYAKPAPENISGPASVCANSSQVYSVTSRAGSVYTWTIPGGAAIIGDPSASSVTVVFGNVGGSIQVRETNIGGCITNHNPLIVTVQPLPAAIMNGGGTICEGSTSPIFVDFTGTGPYTFTYAINGVSQAPVSTSSDPYTLNATLAGNYTIVNVTDATGCTNIGFGSAVVTYYPKPTGIISGGATLCGGTSTLLTMTFTGTPPYTFTYTDGTTPFTVPNYPNPVYTVSVTPTATVTYTLVSVTDRHNCPGAVSGSAVVTVNTPPALTLAGTNLTCNNDNTGSVNLTATGSSPFGFAWTGPGGFVANSEDVSGLKAGTYTVTVTDTHGCISTGSVTLTQPGPVDATLSSTNILCFGSPEGTITISSASGGSGSYEYTINGGLNWQLSGLFTGLNPGTYDVRIRDVLAPVCNKILNGALVLTGPAVLNASVNVTDIVCFGASDGSIIITNPTGGFGTYGYSINGGVTWQGSGSFNNLAPGAYSARIRDAANPACIVVLNPGITITQPPVLSATLSSTNVTCFGTTDGSITISAPLGGHGTFEYSINGGGSWQASGTFASLAPGTYNVQIRDAAYTSCYKVLNPALIITQPAVLRANVTSTLISCFGAADGTITISGATGGSGAYQYTVNGGTNWLASGNFTGLGPGSYDVRIRDAAHTACEISLNSGLVITEPPALSGTVVKTDITCFGAANGNITITNSMGGYGTYEYTINGGTSWQSSNIFNGLSAGTYNVRMRDRVRTTCFLILNPNLVIIEPTALGASVASTNVTCNSANDGSITISSPVGGFGTYQYSINGGGTWQGSGTFLNLSPGSYNVRIRDAASITCSLILNPTLVITEPPALTASVSRTNVTCFNASDGTITITGAAGGYGTYEYTINGGTTWQASNNFTGLLPGFYNVRIRDAAHTSCVVTLNGSLSITQPPVLNASVAKTNITCNGANNGTITISSPTGGYGTYQFSINGGGTWQNSGIYTALPPATYNVQIRDAAQTSCVMVLNPALIITQPAALVASMSFTNITCFGASNGTITISGASGGYGTYEYSINGGTTWSSSGNFTNLPASTYNVIIRDAASTGCTLTLNNSVVIIEPPALNAVLSKNDITCFGASDGSITISGATGGYGTYEYSINGGGSWQNTGTYTGLGPGNYNVLLRDAAQPTCIKVLNNSLTISQPPVLSGVIATTMVTCNGSNDGIINITGAAGGSGAYQYTINGGTNWSASGLFASLAPAVYDVRIRDAAHPACIIILNSALTITEPAALNAIVGSTNISCNGANNGTITISGPTGGYGTYDYTINGGTSWQATGSFTNLVPGTYNVQIRDRAHISCIKILNNALVITQPAVLAATVTFSNVSCFGAGNGNITISGASGGYGTYQYSIDGGVTWSYSGTFSGLVPGSYNVRIRDAANIVCVIILNSSIVITQPAVLDASVTSTNINCSGANDGTITITSPSGGYGTYEYTVNGGSTWQGSGSFISLAPGFYNVQIRDAANPACIIILNGSLRLTEPGTLSATIVKSDITCNGANDGRIIISLPTGGYGTYEYSINGGAGWQSSGSFNGLAPGTYDVRIRDAAHTGCFVILNAALTITQPPQLTATLTSTNVTCNGSNDGTISVTGAAGGYGSYQYSINGGTTWFSSGLFTALAPGTYNVRMRDAANPACTLTLNAALQITQPAALNAAVTKTDVTCNAAGDGTITISAPTGGYGTYEYSINGGGSWQPSGAFTGLGPGNYNVQMRDAAHTGCTKILNGSLAVTQPAPLNAVLTATMITCNGANDGTISITSPSGGYGAYEYTIDGGTNWQASGSFTGLLPATYDVRIRDAAHTACTITLNGSLIITQPGSLNATLQSTNITCNGASDGTISITSPTGGYGTYEYSVNGTTWQGTGLFAGLAPGTYNVQIRDKAHTGCIAILNPALIITQPAALSATITSTNVTCFNASDGTINITNPLGGYGTYGYSVNGGASWQSSGAFNGLAPGTYNVRIRDAANISCVIVLNGSLVITQPAVLNASITSTNVTCYGAGDGTITVSSPSGGYGTYEYTINGGAAWQVSGTFTSLVPGYYNVQIRDAANINCIKILNGALRITEPNSLSASLSFTNITCNGAADGTITISAPAGGYGTYEYSLNGGGSWQSTGTYSALPPATYNVQMRDAAHTGCITVLNAALVITQPAVLTATVAGSNVTCNGANDGNISVNNPAGGYGSYQYSINGGTTWSGSGYFANLVPAVYNVQMRDAANPACVVILNSSLVISQPAVLSATISKADVTCFGASDGTITISLPTGGYGTYEYSINGGGSWQSSGTFGSLGPGNYNVRIRDAAHTGCVVILNSALSITQPAVLNALVTATNITCNGANDGIISITGASGGYGTYQYSIDGGATWSATGLFNNLVPGSYNIHIRDAANTACEVTLNNSLPVNEPPLLTATVSSTAITCFGANNGTITVTSPYGGYGTFEFSITGGSVWQASGTFTNLLPGSYDVRIRDKAHTSCVVILNAALVITEPAILSATVASTNVTCFSANNGTINITNPAGGYGTYQYTINGGSTWQGSGVFSGLAPGNYDVRIRDAVYTSCVIVLNNALIITQPVVLSATVASTNATCFSANDGTITISNPAGGSGSFEYSVTGGASWQGSAIFSSLAPGFYNVQIRDAVNPACTMILNGSLRITEPSVLAATVTGINISCNGSNDGTITITGASGGYGTYEYSINGGGVWQSSGSFNGLTPGTYNVRIRDAAHTGCVVVLNPALAITEPAAMNATVTTSMVSCFNASDGNITISSPTGGYGTYQYSISGGTSWQGSGTFNNLAPGSYDVRIRDASHISCVSIINNALAITQPAVLSANITSTNVSCFGGNDGTITISGAAGGYGTYEYSINGGGSWQGSGTFAGLTTGSYSVLIRDAAHIGCLMVLNNSYQVTQPGFISATIGKTDITCNGSNDGTISVTAPSGGYGTYDYSINGGTDWFPSGSFTGLVPGTYDVRIRDAAHPACTVTLYPNLVIIEPVQLALTSTGNITLNCFGDNTGIGTFYASGGTMPYTFTVVTNTAGATIAFPGFNSQTFFGASAGTVTVSVTDHNGCFAQGTITISQPAQLAPGSVGTDQVLCSGANPATLTEVTAATGGPSAYGYQWQYASAVAGPFINIAGATSSQYTPAPAASTTLYYRRMVTSGICPAVYSNVIEIRINPNPLAILTGGETICPGQNSILKVNMMIGTGPFDLDIENLGTVTGYVSNSDIIVSPVVTTTYRLLSVRDANGCQVVSPSPNLIGSATVTVRALPVITVQPVSKTTCEFGMVAFSVGATGSDLTYQWFVNDGSGFNPVADGGIYFGATSSTLNLFGATRLMNGYEYHAVVSGCASSVTSADASLTVNTPPEIVIQPKDSTICMNAGGSFSVTAAGTSIAYRWQVNKGAGFINVVDDANFNGSNLSKLTITNAPGTFNNYIFRAVLSGICGAPVYSNFAVLRVTNPPSVTLNPANKSACDGTGPVIFSANGSGLMDSLRWQVFTGGVWTDIYDNAVYNGTSAQQLMLTSVSSAMNGNQYRLSFKAKCTTVYSNSATLTVNPNPVVDFSAIDPIHACGGVPLVINGNPSGGSGTWTSHLWTGDVGPLNNYYIQSPTFTSQIAGSYLLTYQVRDNRGCIGTDNVSVVVDAPDAMFSWDINTGCTPTTIKFSKDMTGISKFWWNFDDGSPVDSVNADPVHQFTNSNASSIEYHNVKLTVRSTGGCLASFTALVTIFPSIDATFTASPDTICSGKTVTFTALPGASKYFWDYGDGVSGYSTNSASHLYTNITTAPVVRTVTLTTTSFYNCVDIKTFDIVVMPVPVPQFSADPPSQVFDAAGNNVVFTNETNAGTWNWLWTFGDGTSSTDKDPTHTYTNVGTFTVTLNANNTVCSESISHEVTITYKPPVADFDSLPSGCEPLSLIINNTSLNTDIPGTTYRWDFGDGSISTAKNPTYTYFEAGAYRVELTVTGPGGTSVKSQVVNSYPSPKAYFEVSPTKVFVNDESVRFFNLSQGASYYLWDFGDGDTSKIAEPYHKYMEEGVYDITLWAYSENGCSDKYLLSPGVTVEPAGVLRFSSVFTPNKDGEIDMDHLPTGGPEMDQFFFPPIREKVLKYKLQIFNRWGVLIFETHDINKPWNGYYKRSLCPQGVYVWYVEGKYANGQPFKQIGDITLLH